MNNDLFGRQRLDKLNLMSLKTNNDPAEKILFQHTLLDAVNQYLFFGVPTRGAHSFAEFFFSYDYLYNIRSYEPNTWKDCREMITISFDKLSKKKVTKVISLNDTQIKAMCFDVHFNISNIRVSMDTFLRKLKKERSLIIEENKTKINLFLKTYKSQNHGILNLNDPFTRELLLSPESPDEITKIVSSRAAENKKEGQKDKSIHGKGIKNIGDIISSSNV